MAAGGRGLAGIELVATNTLDGYEVRATTGRDGRFAMPSLPSGLYDLAGGSDRFTVVAASGIAVQSGEQRDLELVASERQMQALGGAIVTPLASLRERFHDSDLVATVVVGRSRIVGTSDDVRDVAAALHVETRFKGATRNDDVVYRHPEGADAENDGEWRKELKPGRRLIAFLRHAEDATSSRMFAATVPYQVFEPADDERGAALAASLGELAAVADHTQRRGEVDPAELVAWMVDTAVDAHTRTESVEELASAVDGLAAVAASTGSSFDLAAVDVLALVDRFRAEGGALRDDPPPAVLGASLTAAQRARLTAALRDARGLRAEDRALADLVHGWDAGAADAWIAAQLGDPDAAVDADLVWWLQKVADDRDSPTLQGIVARADTELDALGGGDEEESDATLDRQAPRDRAEERGRELRALYRDFSAALSGGA